MSLRGKTSFSSLIICFRTVLNEALQKAIVILIHSISYRKLHGCPKIKYASDLARSAQRWAEHLAKTKVMCHSEAKNYGENLAYKWSSGVPELSGKLSESPPNHSLYNKRE